jgi:hypothetical protein
VTRSPAPVTATDAQLDDVVAPSPGSVDLPHAAWISRRDGTRAVGDLEDQAARYHPARHELTINADFRAITDMKTYWRDRYRTIPVLDQAPGDPCRDPVERLGGLVGAGCCPARGGWPGLRTTALSDQLAVETARRG